MDNRYREVKDARDTSGRADRLIGRHLQRASQARRAVESMGGSTGGKDPYEALRKRGAIAAARGAEEQDRGEIFETARKDVELS
jgi:hypothetical protein